MREIIISNENKNQRLDKFLLKYLNNSSKAFIYKMLRKKNIKINNKKSIGDEILIKDDVIQLFLSEDTINKFKSSNITLSSSNKKLDIIYEDNNILVVNKPKNLLSHPINKDDKDTLIDIIKKYLYDKGEFDINDTTFTPAISNRLDRNTSGVVVCGKNFISVQALNNSLAKDNASKYYTALVLGEIKKDGRLESFMTKDTDNNMVSISEYFVEGSKKIITEYYPVCSNGEYTLTKIKLVTGRSHQIRVHLSSIGHPIIGDIKYGDKEVNKYFYNNFKLDNQFLHASSMEFNDIDGDLYYIKNKVFKADLPNKFINILNKLNIKGIF